ncbi:hypothetical protein BDQ94DRAFT_164714 [Aspergillus welwitschiae]|uniref:Uncharacterized protein n=1 Tax=Aspergillus welwitschiae TaxID=1341132 RepID=A0A3F3PGW4_9EURO|nr:hypothetical protein BDQ94DRAFT_164714 [Aspergillus welwitschiae]RDH26161.1 hypothetical protein BDQ94DRAFT_164714 [Aspergillus welwitschiae]
MVMISSYRIRARLSRRSTLRSRYKPGMPTRIDDPYNFLKTFFGYCSVFHGRL